MVSAIPLDDVIQGVREDFEDVAAPTAEELVEAFRSRWSQIFYDGSGFFARELRASDGETAWVVLSPEDGGGYSFHGIFPTPLAAEEHFRSKGWVFSQDPEGYPPTPDQPADDVPSGRWDGYTDDQILNLVLGLTR